MYVLTPISNKINPMQQHIKRLIIKRKKDFSFMGYGEHNYIIYNLWSQEVKQQKNTKQIKDGSWHFLLFLQRKQDNSPPFLCFFHTPKKSQPLNYSFLSYKTRFLPHPKTNPFLLFLGGFYSQMRGLQGAASRVFWQLVCKWGGCLGGCSCRKQGEEKGESDGQVGWWEFAWEKKGESDGRGGWL